MESGSQNKIVHQAIGGSTFLLKYQRLQYTEKVIGTYYIRHQNQNGLRIKAEG